MKKYNKDNKNNNEIPKHKKKKKSSVSKSKDKAKHKHEYAQYLLIFNKHPHVALCCNICGKIYDIAIGETETTEKRVHRILSDSEIYEKYKTLKQVEIADLWQKYIPVDHL